MLVRLELNLGEGLCVGYCVYLVLGVYQFLNEIWIGIFELMVGVFFQNCCYVMKNYVFDQLLFVRDCSCFVRRQNDILGVMQGIRWGQWFIWEDVGCNVNLVGFGCVGQGVEIGVLCVVDYYN